MKITEALQELGIIEKRINHNCQNITKYSAVISTEKPAFSTEDEQKKEINALIKANMDLVVRYFYLHNCIHITNLKTIIEIDGKTFKLSELLDLKKKCAAWYVSTFHALNDAGANMRLSRMPQDKDNRAFVNKLYDEKNKNDKLAEYMSLADKLKGKIEITNATTDLIEDGKY